MLPPIVGSERWEYAVFHRFIPFLPCLDKLLSLLRRLPADIFSLT